MATANFETLSEYGDYLLSLDGETVNFNLSSLVSEPQYEGLLLEAVAMARANNVAVMFAREASDRLIWHRFHCSGKTSSVAWLLYELEAIGEGKRGRDKPVLES